MVYFGPKFVASDVFPEYVDDRGIQYQRNGIPGNFRMRRVDKSIPWSRPNDLVALTPLDGSCIVERYKVCHIGYKRNSRIAAVVCEIIKQ
jgi:hypothetical protein